MGWLRIAFSVAAKSSDDLPRIFSQLDLFADRVPADRCATLCCVVIDPHRRQLELYADGLVARRGSIYSRASQPFAMCRWVLRPPTSRRG